MSLKDQVKIYVKFVTLSIVPITGELDHLPEVAFYMVGPIEEAVAKAERLAEDQS